MTNPRVVCNAWRLGQFFRTFLAIFLICTAANSAGADGDDFFVSELFNPDGTLVAQGGYAGTVRDDKGGYVYDATVRIVVTVDMEGGPHPLAFSAYTDMLGHYRSRDPKLVFATFLASNPNFDPKKIEITVIKDGYEIVRRINRGRLGQTGPFEIDFVLQRKLEKPSSAVPATR